MIKGICFDCDGVLLDAKEWHYEALNNALEALGLPVISLEDHLGKFDGLPTKTKLRALGIAKDRIDAINNLKQEYTLELIKTKYNQNLDTLNAIKILKNEGYKMALCSNSIRKTVDLFLELSEYGYYFDFSLSNQDVLMPKPSPQIYDIACTRMGLPANEVLVLEDNKHGLESASRAGCHILEVTDGVKQVTYRFIKDKLDGIA